MVPTRSKQTERPKRRGRPRVSTTVTKSRPKPTAVQKKTTHKRNSQVQRGPKPANQNKTRGRPPRNRDKTDDEEPDEIAAELPKTQDYVQLAPRTRRIAQEQIDTWPQVSPRVLEEIVAVLRDAKKDIVNTQRDERRATFADEKMEALVRTLSRQLSDSRVPPQAKDIHFNIDKLTECYAQLFREVTTERHSKQLLKEQVRVAEHLLKKDQENLEQLKKNAKTWKATWTRQERDERLHPLLQGLEDVEMQNDGPDDISLKRFRTKDSSMLDDPDPELTPLLEQLRRSLESMQGNHEQVASINEAMRNAEAALDDVVFRHASAQQYAAL